MGLSLPHFASLRGKKQSKNDIFYSRKQEILNFYALESRKILIFILWKAENLHFLYFGKQKMLIFAA